MCRACILLVCNGYPKWPLRSCLEWETTLPGSQTISPDVAIESLHDNEIGHARFGQKQTYAVHQPRSALPPKADIARVIGMSALCQKRTCPREHDVRYSPESGSGLTLVAPSPDMNSAPTYPGSPKRFNALCAGLLIQTVQNR